MHVNSYHGKVLRFIGMTVLSGLVAASLAPASFAAPSDSQETNTETQVSATVLSYPGTNGPTRIHIITTTGTADAILLESRGVFGMIDGGEGVGAPDGSDPRYPLRPGITPAERGDTDWVLTYMRDHGVTSSNLAFYLGTHAHSDHIDNADDIIRTFRPKAIFSPEYSDKWITNPNGLWDNQWIYDNMINAATWARKTYGAQLIQHVDGYNTHVQLGDMDVQIIPFDPEETYKKKGTTDANLMGWGAKVTAFGHSAFLAADLMDTEADWVTHNGFEARVASAVGHVDLLKAGHHGQRSSNFEPFMAALSPSMIVQTGSESLSPDRLTTDVIHGSDLWVPMEELWEKGRIPSLVATFAPSGITTNDLSAASWGHEYDNESPRAWWFQAGRPVATTGWWHAPSHSWYYFAGKPSAEASAWVSDGGQWFRVDETGAMISSTWFSSGGQWYWLGASGAMATSGWINDGTAWYYLDADGHPSGNGWTRIEGSWYYLSAGRAATGWVSSGGTWYYMDPASAAMASGWIRVGGSWYHLAPSGALSTGWLRDGGAWYYMDPASGAMATGARNIDGRRSTFDPSGHWIGYAS